MIEVTAADLIQWGLVLTAIVTFLLGLKLVINGAQRDLKEIRDNVEKLVQISADHGSRLTGAETEIGNSKGWVRRVEADVKELRHRVDQALT